MLLFQKNVASAFLRNKPRKLKFNKPFKNKIFFKTSYTKKKINLISAFGLKYGNIGFRAVESIKLQFYQLAALHKAFNKFCKNRIKIWYYPAFIVPLTKKPSEIRMGKGKGKIERFVANIKKGSMFLEFDVPSIWLALFRLRPLLKKFPIKIKIVWDRDYEQVPKSLVTTLPPRLWLKKKTKVKSWR